MTDDRHPAQEDQPFSHRSVMLSEITDLFGPVPPGVVIDATLGGGGHTRALLGANPHLRVVGIDQDDAALTASASLADEFPGRFAAVRSRFDRIGQIAVEAVEGTADQITGVLFDLGVSSPQLDRADRGFSYRHDAPLDMRMDRSTGSTAADVVNTYDERDLAGVLREFGDERFAGRIARAVVAARPVATTVELAEIVRSAIPAPARRTGGHPAKRTFQAIRIEVNRELDILPGAIDDAIEALSPGGRIAVLELPLGRGSHRQGPPAPGRDRRVHLPARPPVRVRRSGDRPPAQAGRLDAERSRGRREPPVRERPTAGGRADRRNRSRLRSRCGVSPAQAAAEARTSARSSSSSPARAPGPRRPKVVPVREVEQPKGRVAHVVDSLHVGNQLGRIGTLAAAALFLSVFGVVIFQTLLVQGQARLDNLNAQAAAQQERSRDLHQQVADLEAPARIVDAATNRLGMVAPGSVGYLSPSADDATRSTYVAPPETTPPPPSKKKSTTTATTTPATTKKKSTTTTTVPTKTPKVTTP